MDWANLLKILHRGKKIDSFNNVWNYLTIIWCLCMWALNKRHMPKTKGCQWGIQRGFRGITWTFETKLFYFLGEIFRKNKMNLTLCSWTTFPEIVDPPLPVVILYIFWKYRDKVKIRLQISCIFVPKWSSLLVTVQTAIVGFRGIPLQLTMI